MDEALKQQLKAEIKEFRDMAERFLNKEVSVKEFKGYSGGFGSYAQRGGERLMLRLRMNQGVLTKEKLQFICDSCRKYEVDRAHITTCQTIQLHHLSVEAVCRMMEAALDVGIVTKGGGGDWPRNVMCSPLSGVEPNEYFDVLPYAKAVGDYLIATMHSFHLPRKLKVGFSNSRRNEPHATFRDLGFAAREDGTFDVYCCGGLGVNPKMGVRVANGVAPQKVLYYVEAMIQLFMAFGNYTNRARARTRYMQDTLGDRLQSEFDAKLQEAMRKDLELSDVPNAVCKKKGVEAVIQDARLLPQKQEGLYAVSYHPIGGELSPAQLYRLNEQIQPMEEVQVRIAPDQTLYIINLNAEEAKAVLAATNDGARTRFERSVSCIGAQVCQVGLRDSNGALQRLVSTLRPYDFRDGVLPTIHISGCPSSCGTHQIGEIGFQGAVKLVEKKPQPAYVMSLNGSDEQGKERFGQVQGTILESDLAAFFIRLGTAISEANSTYAQWVSAHPRQFEALIKEYIAM